MKIEIIRGRPERDYNSVVDIIEDPESCWAILEDNQAGDPLRVRPILKTILKTNMLYDIDNREGYLIQVDDKSIIKALYAKSIRDIDKVDIWAKLVDYNTLSEAFSFVLDQLLSEGYKQYSSSMDHFIHKNK